MSGSNSVPELRDLPRSLDEARPRLLLRVYGAEQSDVDRLEATVAGAAEGLSALKQVTPELLLGAVVDVAEGYAKVSPATLQSWNCSLEDVIRAGSERAPGHEFTVSRLGDATMLIEDDIYAGAIWVMPQLATSLPLQGAPVAWALGGGITLVTGSDDPNGMTIAATTIQELLQGGVRVESVTPHRLTDLGWEPVAWARTPDGTDELVQRLHKSQVYSRQAEFLTAQLKGRGQDIAVAEYAVVRTEDGQLKSIATWAQDTIAAIPVVDEVVLVRLDGATAGVGWASLFDQAQELLEPMSGLPIRYVTRGFPTDEMVMAAVQNA